MQHDPYRPPQAPVFAMPAPVADEDGCWRSGRDLYMRAGAVLPPRCITCNAPAIAPLKKRTVYWHSGWLYLLVLLSLPIYIIVALIVRKTRRIHPGFCASHTASRRRQAWLGWGLLATSLVLPFTGSDSAVIFALLAFVGALVQAIRLGSPLRALHIDERRAQLRGCGEAFLASLPGRS